MLRFDKKKEVETVLNFEKIKFNQFQYFKAGMAGIL